jgi:hypothetical protein
MAERTPGPELRCFRHIYPEGPHSSLETVESTTVRISVIREASVHKKAKKRQVSPQMRALARINLCLADID